MRPVRAILPTALALADVMPAHALMMARSNTHVQAVSLALQGDAVFSFPLHTRAINEKETAVRVLALDETSTATMAMSPRQLYPAHSLTARSSGFNGVFGAGEGSGNGGTFGSGGASGSSGGSKKVGGGSSKKKQSNAYRLQRPQKLSLQRPQHHSGYQNTTIGNDGKPTSFLAPAPTRGTATTSGVSPGGQSNAAPLTPAFSNANSRIDMLRAELSRHNSLESPHTPSPYALTAHAHKSNSPPKEHQGVHDFHSPRWRGWWW